ncbi:MAG TPA: hypothetical protein VGF75_03340 [Candidatus Saccharimonadales bacterium]|jgi:hypothetical protein
MRPSQERRIQREVDKVQDGLLAPRAALSAHDLFLNHRGRANEVTVMIRFLDASYVYMEGLEEQDLFASSSTSGSSSEIDAVVLPD